MLLLLLAACQRDAPLVLLVSFDTTRADRLGAYGHPKAGTPHLDQLAAEGVLFEWALSQSATTLQSHTTVMSGLDAHGHAVVRNGYPAPEGLDTLAERFQAEGWDTIGVVGASPLEDAMNLDQGFRVWEDHDLLPYLDQVEVGADQVNRRVFEILEETGRPRPTLLFVHYYDPHMPWNSAPMEVLREHVDPAYGGRLGRDLRGVMLLSDLDWVARMSEADKAHAEALYQAEISWTDSQFGELLAGLERRGRMEDALVAVFSDHGESMNDSDWSWRPYGHGPDVDLDIIHVPLILRGTGSLALPTGVRVQRQVRLQDLGTTLLAAAGLEGPLGQGEDLGPLWRGEVGEAPPSFAESTKPIPLESRSQWNNLPFERSVAHGGKLYVTTPYKGAATLHELAPGQPMRVDDPDEEALQALIRAWDQRAPPHRDPQMSAETEEALRKLGYLD